MIFWRRAVARQSIYDNVSEATDSASALAASCAGCFGAGSIVRWLLRALAASAPANMRHRICDGRAIPARAVIRNPAAVTLPWSFPLRLRDFGYLAASRHRNETDPSIIQENPSARSVLLSSSISLPYELPPEHHCQWRRESANAGSRGHEVSCRLTKDARAAWGDPIGESEHPAATIPKPAHSEASYIRGRVPARPRSGVDFTKIL